MRKFNTLFVFFIPIFLLTTLSLAQPSGSALDFDGFDDLVLVTDDPSLDMTDGFTIAAWVYLDSYVEWASIVTKGFFNNNYTIHQSGPLGGSNFGHLRFTSALPDLPLFLESNTPIPLGEWHYVAISYDGVDLQFYLDGDKDGGGALRGPLVPNDEPLFIGIDPPGVFEFWDGKIDEVRIWNVALKQTHIQAAMNGHAAPKASNLSGYWRFDEGEGEVTKDQSPNNNTGELRSVFSPNGPTWTSPGAPIGNSSDLIINDHLSNLVNDNLSQIFPNPFSEKSTIQFEVNDHAQVVVGIFNLNGQELKQIVRGNFQPGIHKVEWDGTDTHGNALPTGSYFYRIDIENQPPIINKIQIIR